MSYYQQPWARVSIAGHSGRLQVLDPATAFGIEGDLLERLGAKGLALAVAAPRDMLEAMGASASGSTMSEALAVRRTRPEAIARALEIASGALVELLARADLPGPWVADLIETVIFDRLRIGGRVVESWLDLAPLGPFGRWHALALQLHQTYGPLWARSPYGPREDQRVDSNVPTPNTSIASQYADMLAAEHIAAGRHEVLTQWTPGDLIDAVENLAHTAAVRREQAELDEAKRKAGAS